MVDALVTDAHSRAAVAGLRALGRGGLRALALGEGWGAAGLWSRYTAARAVGPSRDDYDGFVARIAGLAGDCGPFVVYPGQEQAVGALIARWDALPPQAVLPYPGPAALRVLRDKSSLAALAEGVGLSAPLTLAEGSAAEVASDPPPAPCVVKSPGVSSALEVATVAETEEELRSLLAGLPGDEPIVVQQRARGALVALALVIGREGAVVARFQQVARRLWPVGAGVSSLAVSVAPDDDLVGRAARMLVDVGYWGLAQIQFLQTVRGPALIDVNPRFYGSLPLATAAGVNLPVAWHAVTMGWPAPAAEPYRVGVPYRWLEGELTAAFNGRRGYLRAPSGRPRAGAMWAADDPVPAAVLALGAVDQRVRRRLPGPTMLRESRRARSAWAAEHVTNMRAR